MRTFSWIAFLLVAFDTSHSVAENLILTNGEVYTMEPEQPWAHGLVVEGNKILAVLEEEDTYDSYAKPDTRIIDLQGKFVLPGFIDGHTHFNAAGRLIIDVNLLKVADDEGLREEIARVVGILEEGEWISGGLWGAYEQWEDGAASASVMSEARWKPHRHLIDDLTPHHPCLLNSFDRTLFLANTIALREAGLMDASLEGMELDDTGKPTGLIINGSEALPRIRSVMKPRSETRLLNENRAALKHLRECGVVEIHDIVFPDQTKRYQQLQQNGGLTCRIWLRPDLSRAREFAEKKLTRGLHPGTRQPDGMLRYGAFKGYIDGIMGNYSALFFRAYNDRPNRFGYYRHHTSDGPRPYRLPNMEKMYQLLLDARETGMVANVHAIGTKGTSLMLDTYERLMKDIGRDLAGYRVIHAQVIRPEDFPRFKALNVIAEVNPYHLSDDMRWMEERIGYERCKGAYAFKSLLENGAMLSFASDWPGTSAAVYHAHPKYLIHAAVNRTTVKGLPKGGWFPEQKISVEEALKAYTINNAIAAFEGELRGSIKPGKLADITVCDRNLLTIPTDEILNMEIEMTIVDGKIVYEREKN